MLGTLALLGGIMLTVGCRTSESSNSSESSRQGPSAKECTEPENPYDEGSGHFAGFDWAQNNGSGTCDGHSQSFDEGCEEYERQKTDFDECIANK